MKPQGEGPPCPRVHPRGTRTAGLPSCCLLLCPNSLRTLGPLHCSVLTLFSADARVHWNTTHCTFSKLCPSVCLPRKCLLSLQGKCEALTGSDVQAARCSREPAARAGVLGRGVEKRKKPHVPPSTRAWETTEQEPRSPYSFPSCPWMLAQTACFLSFLVQQEDTAQSLHVPILTSAPWTTGWHGETSVPGQHSAWWEA